MWSTQFSKKRKKNYILIFLLSLNPISHFWVNVFSTGNIYYMGYMGWLTLLLFLTINKVLGIKKKEMLIAIVMEISFLCGSIIGEIHLGQAFNNIHSVIFIVMIYIVTMSVNFSWEIDEKMLISLMKVIVFWGVIASMFAMIFQKQYFFLLLKRENIAWNSWFYVSYFGQRNIFGGYCFLSTIAALYVFIKTRGKSYLFAIICFGVQIFLTNSRTSLLGYVLFLSIFLCASKKNRWLVFLLSLIIVMTLVYTMGFGSHFIQNLYHTTSSGEDSAYVRLAMWKSCIEFWKNKLSVVFGFGVGAVGNYLSKEFGFGSSHNSYIDILFNGGIIYFVIIMRVVWISINNVLKSKDKIFKSVFLSGWIAFLVYNCFEAGMLIVANYYLSITSTLLLVFIPRFYELEENPKKGMRSVE